MGSLGVLSASLLALPAFLASAFGAGDFLTTIFSETFEDVSFTKALEKWLSLTNEPESPLDGTQKSWTQPVYVKTAQDLISRMDDKRSKVFNAVVKRARLLQWLVLVGAFLLKSARLSQWLVFFSKSGQRKLVQKGPFHFLLF